MPGNPWKPGTNGRNGKNGPLPLFCWNFGPEPALLAQDRAVFRIKGNHYRLVARIFYPGGEVYIRFLGTHAEYERINVEEV